MRIPTSVTEHIASGECQAIGAMPPGVRLRMMVSASCGATGFSTAVAALDGEAELPYHTHTVSEAITVLRGRAEVAVEGRVYSLSALDCIHVPAGIAHAVRNPAPGRELTAHTAFASAEPDRQFVDDTFCKENRGGNAPLPEDPETVRRSANIEIYELSSGASFCDLFAHRFGATGICGGFGQFQPGASLPCHIHDYDESITIVEGEAVCLVRGHRYHLRDCDTAFVPKGYPHRFLNESASTMAMLWVYAGDEPDRTIVDSCFCAGTRSMDALEVSATGSANLK